MSLLLLLKPHPRIRGKGQQLVIQRGFSQSAIEQIAESLEVLVEDRKLANAVDSLIAENPFFKERPEAAEMFRDAYPQGIAEGISMEDMVLLFMMTEK